MGPASAAAPSPPCADLLPPDRFSIFGVVHLLPLPGGPRPSPGLDRVRARALADVAAIAAGGAHGVIIENFGDAPFPAGRSAPHVVATMARLAHELREAAPALRLGVNVLRNDGPAALAVAAAVGADFIRVNVLSGATWTDQGLIEGRAHALLSYRRALGVDPLQGGHGVRIFADVLVKHGVPAGASDPALVADETLSRGGADAIIVTGKGTGHPTSEATLQAVCGAAGAAPVLVGSGAVPATLPSLRAAGAAGAIVGTYLHADGAIAQPLDPRRVAAVCAAAADATA